MSLERPTVREALLEERAGPEGDALREAFFRRLRLPGGVTKRTRPGRLADLDALVSGLLPDRSALGDRPLELMDVAVSSGVTTLDWARSLRAAGFDFALLAGDLTPQGWLVPLTRRIDVLVDDQLRLLQVDFHGRGVPSSAPGLLGLLPAIAGWWAKALISCDDELARSLRLGREARGRRAKWVTRVALTLPELAQEPAIRLIEDDLLAPPNPALEDRFDAVRVANLLNRGYFPEPQLVTMLRVVTHRVRPGGLLILCRTEPDEINHATVFRRREAGGLEVVARLGKGSEIEELVVGGICQSASSPTAPSGTRKKSVGSSK